MNEPLHIWSIKKLNIEMQCHNLRGSLDASSDQDLKHFAFFEQVQDHRLSSLLCLSLVSFFVGDEVLHQNKTNTDVLVGTLQIHCSFYGLVRKFGQFVLHQKKSVQLESWDMISFAIHHFIFTIHARCDPQLLDSLTNEKSSSSHLTSLRARIARAWWHL